MAAFFQRRDAKREPLIRGALPRTDDEIKQLLSLLPRYRVLLHNDDYNTMDHVVVALVRTVPNLSPEDAVRVMMRAHMYGNAEVIVCLKEIAEYYREGLERYGLTSTIEPA